MKSFVIIIFVVFVLLTIQAMPIFANETAQKANSMLKTAAEHFTKGEYKQAITFYDKILQI